MRLFIANLKDGCIGGLNGLNIYLQVDGNLSTHFSPIQHPFIADAERLPSIKANGATIHNLLTNVSGQNILDWELKAADTPFDNLDDLLSQCNLPTQSQIGDMTTLEIVAKSPAMVSATSTISNGDAVIECRMAENLDIENIRIGYKVFHKDGVIRASIKGDLFGWKHEDDIKVGTYTVSVGDASLVQAFLSYADVAQHQWWISDPQKHLNPRYAIHQVFDKDLELVKRLLFNPDTDKSYVFEGAVSTLTYLLGFSVANYGRIPKLQKGPDIIAISPNGSILIIECTIGLLDENNKLAKLVQRTKLIKEKLIVSGYSHIQFQPVIISPLSREEVKVNLETAGKHDIAVMCKENIEELINQVFLPPNPDKTFLDTLKLIPEVRQESLF